MERKEDQNLLQEEEIQRENLKEQVNTDEPNKDQTEQNSKYPKTDFHFDKNLQENTNILSKLLFFWMIKFVKKYKKFSFQQKNHYPLHKNNQVENNQKQFEEKLHSSKNLWWFFFT